MCKHNPAYKPIIQKPFCCVPACLKMVLERRKILCDKKQEEIGYQLGLTVPNQWARHFTKVRTAELPPEKYGTQIQNPQYSINNFFQRNRIPLQENYYFIADITDVGKFIATHIKNNNDIIACFNYNLYGEQYKSGHVSLIQEVKGDEVVLVDPGKDVPKLRRVKLSKLTEAMKYHGKENRAGFWVIGEQT